MFDLYDAAISIIILPNINMINIIYDANMHINKNMNPLFGVTIWTLQ